MEELVEKLRDHVQIESEIENEKEYAEFIEKRLQDMGFETWRQEVEEGRFNVLAEKGRGSHEICFYGHLDVVPVYGEWSGDPYDPWFEDGNFYGRGTVDMKAGNLAILESVREVPESVKVKVAFGIDEEYMSKGSTELLKPDFLDNVDSVVVPEYAGRKSMNQIGLGRRGRISIDVKIFGESAHAAHPEKGESAIKNASILVSNIERIDLGEDEDMGEADLTVRKIEADPGSLSIPGEANLILDRHMVPNETVNECLEQVRDLAEELSLDVEVELRERPTPYLKPYKTEEDRIQDFISAVEEVNETYDVVYGDSVADENRIAEEDISVITYGPLGGDEHAPDEYLDIKSLETLIEVFKVYMDEIDG